MGSTLVRGYNPSLKIHSGATQKGKGKALGHIGKRGDGLEELVEVLKLPTGNKNGYKRNLANQGHLRTGNGINVVQRKRMAKSKGGRAF